MSQHSKNHKEHDKPQRPSIFQLGNIFFLRNRTAAQQKPAVVQRKSTTGNPLNDEELEEHLASVPNLQPEQPSFDFEKVSLSEENPERNMLQAYRDRNTGAKDFDDFARGIQTWMGMMEMEAIRRFHDVHMDPIVEACEEYIMRAAEGLLDLIDKALLLCRLRIAKRAAKEVARIALEAIEKTLQGLDRLVPSEMLFTWTLLENELQPVYVES